MLVSGVVMYGLMIRVDSVFIRKMLMLWLFCRWLVLLDSLFCSELGNWSL